MRHAGAALIGAIILAIASATPADAACTISSTGVSFGVYDVFAPAPTVSTGSVTYQCGAQDKDIQITLSTGTSGTFTPRTLKNGTEQLGYNLFLDAALTSLWGNGTGGSSVYFRHNPHPVKPVVVTIYGRIPALQDVGAGSYADTVIVTVNF